MKPSIQSDEWRCGEQEKGKGSVRVGLREKRRVRVKLREKRSGCEFQGSEAARVRHSSRILRPSDHEWTRELGRDVGRGGV